VVAGLQPFEFVSPASRNGAVIGKEFLSFTGNSLLVSEGPPPWLREAMNAETLRVTLDVRPADLDQRGPARLFSVGRDTTVRNLTVGQLGADMVLRVRRTGTDVNGKPDLVARDVFAEGRWTKIDVRVVGDAIEVLVDGVSKVREDVRGDLFSRWDPAMPLALGNEPSGNRPWRGDMRAAGVVVGSTVVDYVSAVALLDRPPVIVSVHQPPSLVPFSSTDLGDAVINLFGFVPLGFLAATGRGRRSRAWCVLAIGFAVSVAIECAQLFLPFRHPSVTDVILNTCGTALGLALARKRRNAGHAEPTTTAPA
jgi:VanZ family protein